jgi:serine/threonine protein kinase
MSLFKVVDELHSNIRDPRIFPQSVFSVQSFNKEFIQELYTQIQKKVEESKCVQNEIIVYDNIRQHILINGTLYDMHSTFSKKKGSSSSVFYIRKQNNDRQYVLKIMNNSYAHSKNGFTRFCTEVLYQKLASDVNVAPKIIEYGYCCIPYLSNNQTSYFILMEYAGIAISDMSSNFLPKSIYNQIYKKYITLINCLNVSLNDITTNNILYHKSTNTIKILGYDPGCNFDMVTLMSESENNFIIDSIKEAIDNLKINII